MGIVALALGVAGGIGDAVFGEEGLLIPSREERRKPFALQSSSPSLVALDPLRAGQRVHQAGVGSDQDGAAVMGRPGREELERQAATQGVTDQKSLVWEVGLELDHGVLEVPRRRSAQVAREDQRPGRSLQVGLHLGPLGRASPKAVQQTQDRRRHDLRCLPGMSPYHGMALGGRPWRSSVSLFLLLGGVACGSPDNAQLGPFTVDLAAGPPLVLRQGAFEVALSDTRSFGFRSVRTNFETQYGAFRITETPAGDFRTGQALEDVEVDGERLTAVVVDEAQEPLADLTLELVGESLRLLVTNQGEANQAFVSLRSDGGPILGFGAQTHDVDHRGQIVPVFVSEQGIGKVDTDVPAEVWFLVGTRHSSYLPVPTFLAPRAEASYGVHATTLRRSRFDLGATDPERLEVQVGEGTLELLFSPGPTPLDVVRQQTAQLGRIRTPPDWTFGVWMEAIGGTEAVRAEALALRAAQIPVSALWSEDWRGGERNGRDYILEEDWRADPVLYAGLPTLLDELHRNGLKWQSYFNTFVVEGVDVAEHLAPHLVKTPRGEPLQFDGNTFEPTGLADLFTEQNRQAVRAELLAALNAGHDGWMADFAEWYPADKKDVTPSDGSDPEVAHQRYPVAWAEVNQEALLASGRDDVVIFHRSGYSGSQGQAQVVWAGDQRTDFQPDDGLPTVVPIMLGLSVTGFPIVTHDIGGYASATNPPTTKELFFRWTSLGALSPVMRTHHGRSAFANWRWSSDAETVAHFRRWAELHTRLWPFFAGLGRAAVEAGAPLLRPMAFADPGDPRLVGVKDQFLIGDALLVAPVVTASTSQRAVILPKGRWFPFDGGEAIEGGGQHQAAAPLTELPIFARAGAIVPTLPPGVMSLVANEEVPDLQDDRGAREIWVWLGANGAVVDAGGGRYRLESPGAVEGTLTAAGGLTVISSGPRELVLEVPANGVYSLESEGVAHVFTGEGHDAQRRIRLRFRW